MVKSTFEFLSADRGTKIHCVKWAPEDGTPVGILQITHGMAEYIERYEEFAQFMTNHGFLVVGHDHLGHGASVVSQEYWGYFAPKGGSDILVEDMNQLRTVVHKEYPQLPYFMLGHSMGSFLLRKYLTKYGANLWGAIIMGTGEQPDKMVNMGMRVCKFLAVFRGWSHRSKLVQKIAFSGNNKKFETEQLPNAWLTKEKDIVTAYNREPRCTFLFTLNGFYNLFDTIHYVNQQENVDSLPKKLPLFLVSGEEDPVGGFGEGIKEINQRYEKSGIEDITWKLYPTDRHEILNETDRKKVSEDIYAWILVRMKLG